MNEEKDLLEQDTDSFEESAEAVLDDIIDGDADQVEETVEAFTDDVPQEQPEEAYVEEDMELVLENAVIPEKKSMSNSAVAVISSLITLVVCAAVVLVAYFTTYNKYNANVDGYSVTLEQSAKEMEMTLDELKEEYGLPKDMRGDTIIPVVQNYFSADKALQMQSGMTFDQFVEMVGLPDDIEVSADMPWGKFQKIMQEFFESQQSQVPEDQATEETVEGETEESQEAPAETQETAAE